MRLTTSVRRLWPRPTMPLAPKAMEHQLRLLTALAVPTQKAEGQRSEPGQAEGNKGYNSELLEQHPSELPKYEIHAQERFHDTAPQAAH